MIEEKIPADWAIEKAIPRGDQEYRKNGVALISCVKGDAMNLRHYPHADVIMSLARYIEAHEKPPISQELLCAREAAARKWTASSAEIESGNWDGCDVITTALSPPQNSTPAASVKPMADNADQATQLEEMERSAALMRRAPSGPVATGQCLWCDSDVEDGRRWCDAGCRDEWEKGR